MPDIRSTQPVAAAPIPFKREEPGVAGAMTGGAIGLLVVSLVVIVLALWARKRLGLVPADGASSGRLRIVETQRLGPRTLLSVVEFGGRSYLLARTEHGVTRIADAEAGADR